MAECAKASRSRGVSRWVGRGHNVSMIWLLPTLWPWPRIDMGTMAIRGSVVKASFSASQSRRAPAVAAMRTSLRVLPVARRSAELAATGIGIQAHARSAVIAALNGVAGGEPTRAQAGSASTLSAPSTKRSSPSASRVTVSRVALSTAAGAAVTAWNSRRRAAPVRSVASVTRWVMRDNWPGPPSGRHRRCGSRLLSVPNSKDSRSRLPTPSTAQWWIFDTNAPVPSAIPPMSSSSQRGRERSRCRREKRTASAHIAASSA